MTSAQKKLLTSAEAAEFLGLTEKTLRNLRAMHRDPRAKDVEQNRPRHYKVGRIVRYRISDLEDFLAKRRK